MLANPRDHLYTIAGVGAGLEAHARAHGIDIKPICSALGIDPAALSDMNRRIGIERMSRLIEACSVIAKDEAFGLKASRAYVAGSTGAYGYGLMSAPTMRDFVRFFHTHHTVVARSAFNHLTIDQTGATVTWSYSPLLTRRDQYVDMVMAIVVMRMRGILGQERLAQVEILLERDAPADAALHHEILTPNIVFGASANGFFVPAALLDCVNPNADPRLFELMDMQCRAIEIERQDPDGTGESLRDFIAASISRTSLSLADVATHFRMSPRTLQRRLADENTTLNDLRDEVRRDMARDLLTGTDLTMTEISERLGYAAVSAFTRSAIRWFGVSPSDFRARRGRRG